MYLNIKRIMKAYHKDRKDRGNDWVQREKGKFCPVCGSTDLSHGVIPAGNLYIYCEDCGTN